MTSVTLEAGTKVSEVICHFCKHAEPEPHTRGHGDSKSSSGCNERRTGPGWEYSLLCLSEFCTQLHTPGPERRGYLSELLTFKSPPIWKGVHK